MGRIFELIRDTELTCIAFGDGAAEACVAITHQWRQDTNIGVLDVRRDSPATAETVETIYGVTPGDEAVFLVRPDGYIAKRLSIYLPQLNATHRCQNRGEIMKPDRLPLFCDTALAERIERVEAQLLAKGSEAARRRRADTMGFVIPIAGGMASFAEEGSPLNKVAGVGFGGVPSAAALDEIERAFTAYGAPVQIELAHLVDPAIGALLTERGYRLESFENVLGLALNGELEHVTPPGVEVRPSGDDEFERWLDVVADAAAHPDTQGVPWHDEFPRETYVNATRDLAAAGVKRYVALRDGVIAGGGGFRIAEGVAQFAGAATAPAHRRRGVQTALLSARLADAAAAGCDVAVITTQPGSKSQQNAQRRGFDVLYTRAVLVKPP